MKTARLALMWGVGMVGGLAAQTPEEPLVLPPTIIGAPRPNTPGSLPPQLLRDGMPPVAVETADKPAPKLLAQTQKFDAGELTVTKAEGRLVLTDGKRTLRDFGYDKASADETLIVIRELGVDQTITIPGSRPLFQIWLKDGKPVRSVASRQVFLPMIAGNLRAESVGGVWVVTDGARAFFDFGVDPEAAKQAAALLIRHGFNQIGLIGNPRPTVMYPMFDKWTAERMKNQPVAQASALAVLDDVVQKNLVLPGNVLAGQKSMIDQAQLQAVRSKTGDWTLMHNEDVLGKFGSSEFAARGALKALQEGKINQVVLVGANKFPIFLAEGQPMRGRPLGSTAVNFRPERLKPQLVRDQWWLAEDSRPYINAGKKADAELLIKVIQHYHLTLIAQYGCAETGGLRFLTTGN